jgi:ribosomal protein S12 methylthiotransferase
MKIGMVSLGCPKNLVDSEVMLGSPSRAASVDARCRRARRARRQYLRFIDKAKQESIDTILEMAELKKTGNCKRLVVTGCMAERYRDELKAQIPEMTRCLGPVKYRRS